MRRHYEKFRQVGADILAVGFAQGASLQRYIEDMRLPFPVVSDPERSAYDAYGLRKGGAWAIFGPKTLWAYARLLARGRLPKGIQGDPYQLGGDFVIDGQGLLRFAYRSEDPTDRPSVDTLLEAVLDAQV